MILNISDVNAKDVKKIVSENPSYLQRVDDHYKQLLFDYGVNSAPSQVGSFVKELLIVYLYKIVYREALGLDAQTLVNGSAFDGYQSKYDTYSKEYEKQAAKLSFDMLSNSRISRGLASGSIRRG